MDVRSYLTLAAGLQGLAAGVAAQTIQGRAVPEGPRCADCSINVMETLRLIGSDSDGRALDLAQRVLRTDDGRYFVVYTRNRHQVVVHDAAGVELRRYGRHGQGPGEFEGIIDIVFDKAGHLHVFDARLGRRTVYDTAAATHERTDYVGETIARAVILLDGRFLASGPLLERATAGYPLHVFDADATWLRSFGEDDDTFVMTGGASRRLFRHLAQSARGEVWAAKANEYSISRWSADGEEEDRLDAERSWFMPWTETGGRRLDTPPPTSIRDISLDASGRMWILIAVPDPDWRDAMDPIERDVMGNPIVRDMDAYWDTIIEVIDPRDATVLTHRRLDVIWQGFAAPDELWRGWTDSNGYPHLTLATVDLVVGR